MKKFFLALSTASIASISLAGFPAKDALTVGGVVFGDSQTAVALAAKKLGLVKVKESTYTDSGAKKVLAYQAFGLANQSFGKNGLEIQYSPLTEKVVWIHRSFVYEKSIPHASVYKSMLERFGEPTIKNFGLKPEDSTSWEYGFNTDGVPVTTQSTSCSSTSPSFKTRQGCKVGVSVSTGGHFENGTNYDTLLTITVIEWELLNKELFEIAEKKALQAKEKLDSSSKIEVPRL